MGKFFDFEIDGDVQKFCKVDGVDESLGLVFGWAIVCKEDGAAYFDVQGDHIPEPSMLKAAAEFMSDSRMMKEMHSGDAKGSVLFAWPLTDDVAKAMGLVTARTGLMVAVKPDDPAILEKFKDGTYTGFSIGGTRQKDEDVTEKRLPADATAEDYIHDFVHSTNPRFKGKSKEERIRMALGAFYSKQVPGAQNIMGDLHGGATYMSNQRKKKKKRTGKNAMEEALKAIVLPGHAKPAKGGWDESKHPRVPPGSADGGQFTSAGGGTLDEQIEDMKEMRRRKKEMNRERTHAIISRPLPHDPTTKPKQYTDEEHKTHPHNPWAMRHEEEHDPKFQAENPSPRYKPLKIRRLLGV